MADPIKKQDTKSVKKPDTKADSESFSVPVRTQLTKSSENESPEATQPAAPLKAHHELVLNAPSKEEIEQTQPTPAEESEESPQAPEAVSSESSDTENDKPKEDSKSPEEDAPKESKTSTEPKLEPSQPAPDPNAPQQASGAEKKPGEAPLGAPADPDMQSPKVFDTKQYHLPIEEKVSGDAAANILWFFCIFMIVAVIGLVLAVDAEKIDIGIELPFDLIK